MLSRQSILPLLKRSFSSQQAKMTSVGNWSLQMPGFNFPLNFPPKENVISGRIWGFPSALDPGHIEYGSLNELVTQREINMMQIMNVITDKPEWQRKIFDEEITAKWRDEVSTSGKGATPKMMDWIIKELQWKANLFDQTGFVEVFDDGVVKSDTTITRDLQLRLQEAVIPFESIPDDKKDYHPGFNGTVIDLVHPSLFPAIYGRTHVLPDRVIGLDDCLESIGEGQLLPQPKESEAIPQAHSEYYSWRSHPRALSTRFQWLPCDVRVNENHDCEIKSYINNAHPVKHRDLYGVVEEILSKTLPLWEKSLTKRPFRGERIKFTAVEYEENDADPEPEYPADESDDAEDEYQERVDAWWARRKIILPEPGEFRVTKPLYENVKFLKHFPEGNLQVIVKLANIELNPEKPDYAGGTWHIEGQLNERIAASAIYYYDSENITPSSLAFRHRGMDDMTGVMYEQDRHEFMHHVYGFPEDLDNYNSGLITQELGSIESKEGRLITFPNTLQHKVSPFSLADPSRPGHRKILALFLVDPHTRIISSANVPPQQEDWRSPNSHSDSQQPLASDTKSLISLEEAKEYRAELMEERGLNSEESNIAFQEGSFSLCEH